MIPVRLTLKDFLSYGDPDAIDFTGFDVACLTGDNGVGKSAFLDAITWALFGAARGCENGQNQDRLIRDGADETMVDFTFALDDALYRIVRRRSKARGGSVRFEIRDGDGWTNIAGETMRDTEARISSTLRMDYDTFTASAFFVQGRAEDFLSRMKAEQRKEVFASLLDLGVYEKLEEVARTRARDAGSRREELARRIEGLGSDAFDLAEVRTELATAKDDAVALERTQATAEANTATLRDALAALRTVEATADGEAKLIANLEGTKQRAETTAEAKRRAIAEVDELVVHTDEVRESYEALQQLTEEEGTLREREREAADLRAREAELRERIKAEHDATLRRIDDAKQAIKELTKERSLLEKAERELTKATAALASVQDAPIALDEARKRFTTLRADEARLLEASKTLDVRTDEIGEHQAILKRGGGECPVCGSALDAAHRKEAAARLRGELKTIATQRDALEAELDVTRKEAQRCQEEGERLRTATDEREKLLAATETFTARLERLPVVVADLDRLSTESAADADRITKDLVAPELETELTATATKRAAIYDPDAHTDLVRRIEAVRPSEALWHRIVAAAEQRTVLQTELDEALTHARTVDAEIATRTKELDALRAKLGGLTEAEMKLREGEDEGKAVAARLATAAAAIARLEERLAAGERTERDLAAARTEELTAATEHRRYRRLAEAFGRNGIPALVMDNVLPQLTEEANDLLGELSNYEMYVQFDLKRPTKSGKERDTFDVRVHHSGGEPRDFAMFSGGEAFRIAFAVRLAMSKLLVRRAGAQLQTLVVDEGFGTQDPEGRERLIAAIKLAQREFRKVLVITHLDELKDAFDTQIRVTKDRVRGSVVETLGS